MCKFVKPKWRVRLVDRSRRGKRILVAEQLQIKGDPQYPIALADRKLRSTATTNTDRPTNVQELVNGRYVTRFKCKSYDKALRILEKKYY